MTKFKVGDKVRRTYRSGHLGVWQGDCGIVTAVSRDGQYIQLEGINSTSNFPFSASAFELVEAAPAPVPPSLPLTFVLKMDREIAKAGGSHGILEDCLDRPLNEFIQHVMIPNNITLQFNS
jgi:hypothetical protein